MEETQASSSGQWAKLIMHCRPGHISQMVSIATWRVEQSLLRGSETAKDTEMLNRQRCQALHPSWAIVSISKCSSEETVFLANTASSFCRATLIMVVITHMWEVLSILKLVGSWWCSVNTLAFQINPVFHRKAMEQAQNRGRGEHRSLKIMCYVKSPEFILSLRGGPCDKTKILTCL